MKITNEDVHNLYDLLTMVDDNMWNDLKLNKMDKWFASFFNRVEAVAIPELSSQKTTNAN